MKELFIKIREKFKLRIKHFKYRRNLPKGEVPLNFKNWLNYNLKVLRTRKKLQDENVLEFFRQVEEAQKNLNIDLGVNLVYDLESSEKIETKFKT